MAQRKNLTKKQKDFAVEYLKSFDGVNAAIKAGYSMESAASVAKRNLENPIILEYMDSVLLKGGEGGNVADIREIMEYLTRVMRREETEEVVVTYKQERVDYKKIDDEYKQIKEKTETPKVVNIPIKQSYSMKAAQLLAKIYGVFTDNEEVETNKSIKISLVDD